MKSSTHTVSMLDDAGRVLDTRRGVPTADVLEVMIALLREHGWQGRCLDVKRERPTATTAAEPPPSRMAAEDGRLVAISHASKFFLTGEQVLHRLPLAAGGAGDPTLRSGPGPGGLVWHPIEEHGMRGLSAKWYCGNFKILRVGTGHCALFLERRPGDWESIALGEPDALQRCAGDRATTRLGAPPLSEDFKRAIELELKVGHRGGNGA